MKQQNGDLNAKGEPIIEQRQFEFKSTLAMFDDGCDYPAECSPTNNGRANISRTTSESSGVHSLFSNPINEQADTSSKFATTTIASGSSSSRLLSTYDKEANGRLTPSKRKPETTTKEPTASQVSSSLTD